MNVDRFPAIAVVVAGTVTLMAGLALLVAPPRGTADTGALPVTATASPAAASPSTVPVADEPPGRAFPVRLVIPALAVQAWVMDAPIETSGRLVVPADPRHVGWWVGGALPGAPAGTLAMAGHVDDRDGPGALFGLRELPLGATVYVDGDTRRYAYRVTARRTYPKQRLPADVFDPDGPHRLVLITCGGAFHDGHYDDNVVVYAEPLTRHQAAAS